MPDVSKSSVINARPWIWLILNILVPTVGVLVLNWDLFGLLYIFWFEMIFLGLFGLLRMLFAGGDKLMGRIAFSVFYAILYLALLLIVISFSLSNLNFEQLFSFQSNTKSSNLGLNWSIAILFASYSFEFLKDFMLSERYKTQMSLIEAFKTFAYSLPLACVILFAIVPISEKVAPENLNTFIILGIVLAKAILDFMVKKGSHYFNQKQSTKEINF